MKIKNMLNKILTEYQFNLKTTYNNKKDDSKSRLLKPGAEGFEPPKCLDQNQVPYHLATPHQATTIILYK